MRDPSGTKHVLRTEIGDIRNVAVAIREGTPWVYYLRAVSTDAAGRRWGTWAIARVNATKGRRRTSPSRHADRGGAGTGWSLRTSTWSS